MESKTDTEIIKEKTDTKQAGEDGDYHFVKETIIDRKTRIKQGLAKMALNLLLIVGACAFTSFIFIQFINERQKDEDNHADSSLVAATVMTTKESTDETATEEITAEKFISSSTMEFKGVAFDTFNTFSGVVLSKNKDIIAITNSDNVFEMKNISTKIGDKKEVPVEIVSVDEELHIAYLKVERGILTEEEIKSITVPVIVGGNNLQIGDMIKYITWSEKSGMTLVDGKIVSQGVIQSATDIIYNKYMIDVSLTDIKGGFVYDDSGNLLAMGMLQEGENGKISVVDLTDIRTEIYNFINKGYSTKLGVVLQEVSGEVENLVGMKLPKGIFVTAVGENSPAYDGGIMAGDVIYKIDSSDVKNYSDFRKYLNSKKKGDTVTVYLYRRLGSRLNQYEIKVMLGERK